MNSKKNIQSIALLLLLFFMLIIIGRYVLTLNTSAKPPASVSTTTISHTDHSQPETVQLTSTNSTTATSSIATCAAQLKASIDAAHTQYEAGTILVRFASTVDLTTAHGILIDYGATVDNEELTRSSYSVSHLITADVPQGKEFTTICALRENSNIQYANINPVFMLHE